MGVTGSSCRDLEEVCGTLPAADKRQLQRFELPNRRRSFRRLNFIFCGAVRKGLLKHGRYVHSRFSGRGKVWALAGAAVRRPLEECALVLSC